MQNKTLKPKEIVKQLDKYVISQDKAKRSVAIALRNRWRRQNADKDIRDEIMPNNIIMIGPTGVGKTEIARRLASLADSPFIKVEATKFTEVGYVGRDVESIIRDLTEMAIELVKTEYQNNISDSISEKTKKILLNLIVSETSAEGMSTNERSLFKTTVENIKTKLENGDLDDMEIEMEVPNKPNSPSPLSIGGSDPDAIGGFSMNLGELLKGIASSENNATTKIVTVAEARNILHQLEIDDSIDEGAIVKEALDRVQNHGIVFIDEIDKITLSGNTRGADVSRQGVQRDLLPIVEGSTVKTRYGFVKTDHILFIASGAFHMSKPSDLIPELQGRFPIRVNLMDLTTDDFVKILKHPQNALLKQYQALLKSEDIEITFTDKAIDEIAKKATEVNDKTENIGARRLHTIMTQILDDVMFNAPDVSHNIKITEKDVNKALSDIIAHKDLSQYIL